MLILYRILPIFIFALVAVAQQCRYKSYESIMLEDHNREKFIPAPIAFECRVPRLGNSYEAAVPHPILQNKLVKNKYFVAGSNIFAYYL